MERANVTRLGLLLVVMLCLSAAASNIVPQDEALKVADNWIRLIVTHTGEWNGARDAEVIWIEPFVRGTRVLGHFCRVRPSGYILVSLRRELAPIKAYSTTCNLDPSFEDNLTDLLMDAMEGVIVGIETRVGPIESVSAQELDAILEINYRDAWKEIEGHADDVAMNYQEGEVLLTSSWRQGDPYNQQCPAPPSGDDCDGIAPHCAVGCVATAAAQIMRYWCWPPYGYGAGYDDPYDWVNMPDIIGSISPQVQIDAVAELSHEAGVAADMDYCGGTGVGQECASGAYDDDMEDAYENTFRYTDYCVIRYRSDYSAEEWFDAIKLQLNANQPTQYGIPGHSFVCDGWREIGSVPLRQYHMNYGWGGWVPPDNPAWSGFTSSNTWFTLDALPGGNPDDEQMIENIHPDPLLGNLSGSYPPGLFPYRYVGRDITGTNATFESGQNIQFLPNVEVTCTSTSGGAIRFYGTSSSSAMRLFSRGDISKGAKIVGGAIKLTNYGSIVFR